MASRACRIALVGLSLLARGAAGAEAVRPELDWMAERKLAVPDLDLEVVVRSSLRLSKTHTAMYTERLLDMAREVFTPHTPAANGKKESPTYRATIEHEGTIEFGDFALFREARGRVFRGGEFVGGGKERRWILPVHRSCWITCALFKRSGESFLSPLRFTLKEPLSWDEQLYGGPEVASAIRTVAEAEPRCPLRREEAIQKALSALEPPAYGIKPLIYKHLVELRVARLADPGGSPLADRKRPPSLVAQVSAENNTPWFLHRFRGKLFTRCPRNKALYYVSLDFSGVLPPGKTQTFSARATEFLGSDVPPWDDLSDFRWSLKGQP